MLLKLYKGTLSTLLFFLFGRGCKFTPTCSEYAADAVTKYGILKGTVMSIKRIGRCHPLSTGGYDPVQ